MKPGDIDVARQADGGLLLTVACWVGHPRPYELSLLLKPGQDTPEAIERWSKHLRTMYLEHRGQMH